MGRVLVFLTTGKDVQLEYIDNLYMWWRNKPSPNSTHNRDKSRDKCIWMVSNDKWSLRVLLSMALAWLSRILEIIPNSFLITSQSICWLVHLHLVIVYTKIWKKMLQGLKSSQDLVVKESIACRSELVDLDAKIGIGFPQIALVDNNKGYVRRQDETCQTLQKGKD